MACDPGYMVEPESVLPTPAPVTTQTSLMTSREIVACGETSSGSRMRRWARSRCRRRSPRCPCGCRRRTYTRGRRRSYTRASAIDVKHDVHVRESNVSGRCRIIYPAIGRAQIAQASFGIRIRTDEEQVANSCSIRCHHFHHQLERSGCHRGSDSLSEDGIRLIRNVDRS